MTGVVAARRALGLGAFTIGYNVVEGVIAIVAGLAAGAAALVGFGFDSAIEVLSATVVVVRLAAEIRGAEPDERKEKVALRIVAVTFFVLAAYLLVQGVHDLLVAERPDTSPVGIVLTAASIVIMPTLAAAKRRVGLRMGSRLVVADAAETRLCAVLSVTTFLSLVLYLLFGWTWLDPVAGFVIAVFAVLEGREAWEGDLDGDEHRHSSPGDRPPRLRWTRSRTSLCPRYEHRIAPDSAGSGRYRRLSEGSTPVRDLLVSTNAPLRSG